MKKLFAIAIIMVSLSTFLMGCAGSQGKGCPTTNPRYFKG